MQFLESFTDNRLKQFGISLSVVNSCNFCNMSKINVGCQTVDFSKQQDVVKKRTDCL